MVDQSKFRQVAAVSAIVAAPLQVLFLLVSMLAIDFNVAIMADPTQIFTLGEQAAALLRWGGVLEIMSFSLLIVAPALYLRRRLSFRGSDLVNLFTIFGLAGLFIGATGAALRHGPMTALMQASAQASSGEREILTVVSAVFLDVIFLGVDFLGVTLVGLWFLGIGFMLQREWRGPGLLMFILGVGNAIVLAGALFKVDALVALGQFATFLLPIWTFWLGIAIWRHDEQRVLPLQPSTAA